jgi:DNA-binding CsgD family transcriptional regulator
MGPRARRIGGIGHVITSVLEVSDDGAIAGIALNRAIGERDALRERRLLEFFHAELGRLIGGPLVSPTEPGVEGLSPRLRQTLTCLLEGDREKQVAGRLGLSPATVHQYATALYRRCGVQSGSQLLAHVFRRLPGAQAPLSSDPAAKPQAGTPPRRSGFPDATIRNESSMRRGRTLSHGVEGAQFL